MKLVVNTSFEPHFCGLFDPQNQLVASSHWLEPRQDGAQLWNFLQVNTLHEQSITFIGGVAGPGSFASLRTTGTFLNALAFRFKIPMHQVRADQVIADYLDSQNQAGHPYLLNSFGQNVFYPQQGKLERVDLASDQLPDTPFITAWIPESKKSRIKISTVEIDPLGPLNTIRQTLERQTPQAHFIPDYEYPPVQP